VAGYQTAVAGYQTAVAGYQTAVHSGRIPNCSAQWQDTKLQWQDTKLLHRVKDEQTCNINNSNNKARCKIQTFVMVAISCNCVHSRRCPFSKFFEIFRTYFFSKFFEKLASKNFEKFEKIYYYFLKLNCNLLKNTCQNEQF
jgi:hypothetical protein